MASIYDFLSEDSGLITGTVNGFLPRTALIPLKKVNQDNVDILIKEGDSVKEGQVIARSSETNVHSSIPGKIKQIIHTNFADGSEGYAAEIELSGAFTFTGKKTITSDWKSLEPSAICYMLQDKGVLNTFGEAQPLNIQIKNLNKESAGIVVVRLYSEDPSRISDSFITDHYLDKIIQGGAITAKAMGAKAIVFACDSNKDLSQFDSNQFYKEINIEHGFVSLDAKSYPCGFMHEITQAVKEKYKDSLLKKLGNRDLFIDVQTALNVYTAVCEGKPVINCHIHITGDCLNAASVATVKIGTTLEDLVKQTGNFKRKLAKIIINGVVTGNTIDSLRIPVSKDVKSVAFVPKNQIQDQIEENCIRCGNCTKICPVGLYPESLYRSFISKNEDIDYQNIVKKTAEICTGCSLCNSVCPSRIPLSQIIAQIKTGKSDEK